MGESDCDAAHKWGEWGEAWISHPRQPRSGSAGSGPGSGSPMPKDIRPGIPLGPSEFPLVSAGAARLSTSLFTQGYSEGARTTPLRVFN